MLVRSANINDVCNIKHLILELESFHNMLMPDIFKDKVEANIDKQIKNILRRNNSAVFIAEIDNAAAGMIQVSIKNVKPDVFLKGREYALLENFIVKTEYRNLGIGKMLLCAGEDYAKSLNIRCIELNVYEINNNAVKFYERYGYAVKLRRMKKDI